MTLLRFARVTAFGLSASTFVFLFLHDSWRTNNLFLVPDLLLCVGLALAAAMPGDRAAPYLITAFAYAAGVLATSVSSYAVDGRLGLPSLVGALGSLALAGALLVARRPAGQPA
ncbi:hypothetical protein [Cryptosporangium japonicum]|uniref:Uncharacterized protein n=1 Tax=Cryptosporangium japonicum TaxID=80872 RepID=A0ABN0V8Q4_9ACTN